MIIIIIPVIKKYMLFEFKGNFLELSMVI
jgi:hypothetical protein